MSSDRIRHILKAITWRVVGTIDTVLLGWLITGNLELGLKIGGVEVVTKMVLYYVHERIWYKYIRLGNKP
jgi:adenylylsulfate kinase